LVTPKETTKKTLREHWEHYYKKDKPNKPPRKHKGYAGSHPPVCVHTYPVTRKSQEPM